MSDGTKIEWTEATWNPIRARNRATGGIGHFCVHQSPGCVNCYSERMQPRFGNAIRFGAADIEKVEIFIDDQALAQPLRWRKPRMIFVCSMTDLFADFVTDEWIDRVFAVMALCPQHTFQVLTKRSARMREYFASPGRSGLIWRATGTFGLPYDKRGAILLSQPRVRFMPLPNVWLGVSIEDQARADERVPDLLATPAAVRWLSCEPLLGPVWPWHELILARANRLVGQAASGEMPGIDWIVAGGESGPPHARPMHPDWARSLRDQCAAADVPFFFKQWGEWAPGRACIGKIGRFPAADFGRNGWMKFDHFQSGDFEGTPPDVVLWGKKRARRLLDGQLHDAMPARSA